MNLSFLCAAKCPSKKPCLKAKIPQITVFKALSYVYKHRDFLKWPLICIIFIFKKVRALFPKI